jgi:hypothetical protein
VVDTVNQSAAKENFELAKPLVYVGMDGTRIIVLLVTLALVAWAIWQSKKESVSISHD